MKKVKILYVLFAAFFSISATIFANPNPPEKVATHYAYLKLENLTTGEAQDSRHKDWIPILFIENENAIGSGLLIKQLTMVLELDKSSTKLQEACANGRVFPAMEVMETTRPGLEGRPMCYLKYKLERVQIKEVKTNTRDPRMPKTRIVLNFEALRLGK